MYLNFAIFWMLKFCCILIWRFTSVLLVFTRSLMGKLNFRRYWISQFHPTREICKNLTHSKNMFYSTGSFWPSCLGLLERCRWKFYRFYWLLSHVLSKTIQFLGRYIRKCNCNISVKPTHCSPAIIVIVTAVIVNSTIADCWKISLWHWASCVFSVYFLYSTCLCYAIGKCVFFVHLFNWFCIVFCHYSSTEAKILGPTGSSGRTTNTRENVGECTSDVLTVTYVGFVLIY